MAEGSRMAISRKVTSTVLSQLAVWLTSIFFALSLCSCSDKTISEEDQIKAVINKAVTAAENKELGVLIDLMAEGYSDKYNSDRKQAGKMLRLYFFRNKSIHLITKIKAIEILDETTQQTTGDDKRAILQIYIGLAGRPVKDESPINVRADLLLFTMDMVKDDGDWLVEKADWKRASPDDL